MGQSRPCVVRRPSSWILPLTVELWKSTNSRTLRCHLITAAAARRPCCKLPRRAIQDTAIADAEQMKMAAAPWQDIPPEFLGLVLVRLPSLADRVRVRAVCRPWRAGGGAQRQPLPPPLPWLALGNGCLVDLTGAPVRCAPILGSMMYLQALNLGHNDLTGDAFAGLRTIGVLDLSHNHLTGDFLPGLGGLSFLADFDVSNNNLTGEIPRSGQLMTFPASRYDNNSGIRGIPLPPCSRVDSRGGEPKTLVMGKCLLSLQLDSA